MLSFTTGNVEVSRHVVEATQLFSITVSFGSTSSLISLPCYMSHASIPAEVRAARGLPDDLVRISAGIEDLEDLIADLDAAFQGAKQAANAAQDGSNSTKAGTEPLSGPAGAESADADKVEMMGEEQNRGDDAVQQQRRSM